LSRRRIAVVGGGASGIMASLLASENCEVHLFEKEKRTGRKILVSGNGRCNISNSSITPGRYHGSNIKFVNNVFGRFSNSDTTVFFMSIGLPLVEKQDGKLFPASLQSSSVTKIFDYELGRRGVSVHLGTKIDRIIPGKNGFEIITSGKEKFKFDNVILSCGSCAYPSVGGSRSGYELAQSLGHKIIPPFPVILPLNIEEKKIRRLQGIKWDCELRVLSNGRILDSSAGELLFTAYGISGPVTLNISRTVNECIINKRDVIIEADFFPDYSIEEMGTFLDSLWIDGRKKLLFSLYGVLKEKMPEILLEMSGINPEMKTGDITPGIREKVISALKSMKLHPGKPRGFDEAVAAAGGIAVDEIDPFTMESRIVRGLFCTGELLDIDGDSGGFNLQFAWSTGAIAGSCLNNLQPN